MGKKTKLLGRFNNVEDAFNAYKQAKKQSLRDIANKWKDKIKPNVYEALINYKIEITD